METDIKNIVYIKNWDRRYISREQQKCPLLGTFF